MEKTADAAMEIPCMYYTILFMYYTVCHFTGIIYALVRQISMLFVDNKDSVVCIHYYQLENN